MDTILISILRILLLTSRSKKRDMRITVIYTVVVSTLLIVSLIMFPWRHFKSHLLRYREPA